MSKPAKALYTKDFLLATIASVFVGGYSILLLTLTLMYGNDAGFTAAAAGTVFIQEHGTKPTIQTAEGK